MTQDTHTFVHSPQGLKMIKRQTSVPKGQGNSYRPAQQPANRLRAGHQAGLHPEDAPYITGNQRTHSGAASKARQTQASSYDDDMLPDDEADIDGNGDIWPMHIPKSARYYPQPGQYDQGDTRVNVRHAPLRSKQQSIIPPRRSRQAYKEEEDQDFEEPETQQPLRTRPTIKLHWLVFAGVGLLLMLAGWMALNDLGAWWQNHQDDATYGMPRTYQTDAVVGHGDSNSNPSHFIAINLRGSIYILEAPGGNFSKSRSYFITTEVGGNPNPPVTVKFQDLTHSGHLDMVVTIGDPPTPLIVFLFNNGSQFLAKSQ